MVKLYCIFNEDHKVDVLFRLQDLGLVQFFDIRARYPYLEKPKAPTRMLMGELDRVQRMLAAVSLRRKLAFLDKLLGPKMAPISIVPKSAGVILKEIGGRLNELEEEYHKLKPEDFSDFRKRHGFALMVMEEQLRDALVRMRAYEMFGATKETLTLGCWVARKNAHRVERVLKRATNDSCVVSIEEPAQGEKVPTLLDNPSVLRPFELLAETYGLPEYRGIDPTPFLALTFTLFFGLMFADVGYGLVLSILSLVLILSTKKGGEVQLNLNRILLYAGVSSITFGLLFGEFFGGLVKMESRLPSHDIAVLTELLMTLAISIGIIHITISIISRITSNLWSGEPLLYPASLLMILWSAVLIAFSRLGFLPFEAGFMWYLLVLGILLLISAKKIEAFDELIALFANIISYSRLAIISVLHVMVARLLTSAVYSLPRTFTGFFSAVFIFAIGVALLLPFGVFITFVHSLRLHWLEFFKRFYSGIGEKFKPFKAEREYTFVL